LLFSGRHVEVCVFLSLRELELRKVEFSVAVPAGLNEFPDQHWRQAGPIEAAGCARLESEALEEIRISGHLHTGMEGDCDRCLEAVGFVVDTDFDVCYRPARFADSGADEKEIEEAESNVAFYEGDGIELNDVLREQVILSLPMQRLCREDCRGICPVCGKNRNVANCGCCSKPADDRWAALKQI
jgi:uncharacterized protein